MFDSTQLLWNPLLEAAAQTITGALGSIVVGKAISHIGRKHTFDGVLDLWKRGIHIYKLEQNTKIQIDCLISPFTQLFPADPFDNAKKWNSLYTFEGKISKTEYQTLEFFAGSDAALRINNLNGETLVGLYDRYGFIGEGLIGVAPTKLIKKYFQDFFHPEFIGSRALITGRLLKCPSQHGFIAQSIGLKAGVEIDLVKYKNLWFLHIDDIKMFRNPREKVFSLLGTAWAVTDATTSQYMLQYGYLSNKEELKSCSEKITLSNNWENAKVYFDDLVNPDSSKTFRNNYLV